MRLNQFVAQASGLSRRAADKAISDGRVYINNHQAKLGEAINDNDTITLDGKVLHQKSITTIMLNKPVGYVCSRKGQGNKTIYDLLPKELFSLKTIGRLDKDSSGLLLLTNDGQLANKLTHPSFQKLKVYEIELDKALEPLHQQMICDYGIKLEDGNSRLVLESLDAGKNKWRVIMTEGRNRQIRRTFDALGYSVQTLHRTTFGPYHLKQLGVGQYKTIDLN